MNPELLLSMAKDSLAIKNSARDSRLTAIINGVIKELEEEQGLALSGDNPQHLLFVTDYVTWRHEHPGDDMPRHLKFRLHNLIISSGGDENV